MNSGKIDPSGVFDGGFASGDRAHLEHLRQGFLPARNVWPLNPWHFNSRFPAAKCVFDKLSGDSLGNETVLLTQLLVLGQSLLWWTNEDLGNLEDHILTVPVIHNIVVQHNLPKNN
jgi:hypothetical protein